MTSCHQTIHEQGLAAATAAMAGYKDTGTCGFAWVEIDHADHPEFTTFLQANSVGYRGKPKDSEL